MSTKGFTRAVALTAAIAAAATVHTELTTATTASAGNVYPLTRADDALIIWGHDPNNKWLVGYIILGRSIGRGRIYYGVWCCRNGSLVTGQLPGNSIPSGFVRDDGEPLWVEKYRSGVHD